MYYYLVEQGQALEPNFGEITSQVKSVNSNRKIKKRVNFANKVQFQDGSRSQLNSFKITLNIPEQIYLYGSHFVECSNKELQYVKLLADS